MTARWDYDSIAWPDTPFDLKPRIILAGRRGSEAHGTYIPPTDPNAIDDRDVMAIVVPPKRYYFGISKWEGADSIKGCWDVVTYELRKFIGLLVRQNPNVVGMLWLRPEDYLFLSPEGRRLIEARALFRNRTAAHASFVGYAYGQLKRTTHFHFEGYMGAKRKALAEKHGYDTKNAAHLIRLLSMGSEFLRTGEMQVYRTHDRDKILSIKRGEWELERVKVEAERLFKDCDAALAASPLPDSIDLEAVNALTVDLVRAALKETEGGP